MRYTIELGQESIAVCVDAVGAGRYRVRVGDGEARVVSAWAQAGLVHLHTEGRSVSVRTGARGEGTDVHAGGLGETLTILDARAARLRARRDACELNGSGDVVRSPMPGRVVSVMVAVGDTVTAGQGVAIVEAMKMENELRCERAGVVEAIHVRAGDAVESNAELVTLGGTSE